MKSWTLWLIDHKMTWALKLFIVLSYPLVLISYWDEALEEVQYTLKAVDRESNKTGGVK